MNPFTQRSIIKDTNDFFGRKSELRNIFNRLKYNQSCSIVGPRRIGKSSLLYYLCQPEIYHKYLKGAEKYVFVFIDLLEFTKITPIKIFNILSERIKKVSNGKLDLELTNEEKYDNDFLNFAQRAHEKGWKLVFCFDEFEKMCGSGDFDDNFFSYLRAIGSNYSIAYLTASRQSLFELCHKGKIQFSEFWNIFTQHDLGLMPKNEAEELIGIPFKRAKVNIDKVDEEFILSKAGRHPLFIQIACFHLFEAKRNKTRLDNMDYDLIHDRFYNEVLCHFKYSWEHLQKEEQRVVFKLAKGFQPQISKGISQNLKTQGVVIEENEGLILFSESFRHFVLEQSLTDEIDLDLLDDEEKRTKTKLLPDQPTSSEESIRLSIFLWNKRSIVLELKGPARLTSQCIDPLHLDSMNIEEYRRRVNRLPHMGDDWREEMKIIGGELFKEIFLDHTGVHDAFSAAFGQIKEGSSLSLTFKCPRESISLPVELLFPKDFISGYEDSLVLNHPINKFITGIYYRKRPLSKNFHQDENVRLLFLVSDTYGNVRIEHTKGFLPRIEGVKRELQILKKLLRELKQKGVVHCKFDFIDADNLTFNEIENLLNSKKYDLIHYAGHGVLIDQDTEKSSLFFWENGQESKIKAITANDLKDLIKDTKVKFFYLSCCEGAASGREHQLLRGDFLGIMDSLIVAKVPAILGMRWPLSDQMAPVLAESFYRNLFETGRIDMALYRARCEVARRNKDDMTWASPILVLQEG